MLPQVQAGGYRIDLVVEGEESHRPAIECDGDRYHTPEHWLADIARQRVLERMGWTFWRCWGSSFLRDPQACLTELFGVLEKMRIAPLGSVEVDLTGITEYREVGVPEEERNQRPTRMIPMLCLCVRDLRVLWPSRTEMVAAFRGSPSEQAIHQDSPGMRSCREPYRT